jgi:hypothetical protein
MMTHDDLQAERIADREMQRNPPKTLAIVLTDTPGGNLLQFLKRAAGLPDTVRVKSITCHCESTKKVIQFSVEIVGSYDAVESALKTQAESA